MCVVRFYLIIWKLNFLNSFFYSKDIIFVVSSYKFMFIILLVQHHHRHQHINITFLVKKSLYFILNQLYLHKLFLYFWTRICMLCRKNYRFVYDKEISIVYLSLLLIMDRIEHLFNFYCMNIFWTNVLNLLWSVSS